MAFQALLPPYQHQFANNCKRMDIYPIVKYYYHFDPTVLQWPEIDGKLSLKLENLNIANNLVAGDNAHRALFDVEVTVELTKKLMQNQELWHYICKNFDKRTDEQRTLHYMQRSKDHAWSLESHPCLLMVSGNSHNLVPVMMLTERNHYPGSWYVLKLGSEGLNPNNNTDIEHIRPFLIRKNLVSQAFYYR